MDWNRLKKCGITVGDTGAVDSSSGGSLDSKSISGTATATATQSEPLVTQWRSEQSGRTALAATTWGEAAPTTASIAGQPTKL